MTRKNVWGSLYAPVAATTTALAGVLFLAGLPGIEDLPGWFYRPLGARALSPEPLVLVGLLFPVAAVAALRAARAGSTARTVVALVVASLSIQVATTAADAGTVIARLEQGHGELLAVAHRTLDEGVVLETMREYEAHVESGALGAFAPSKPQGTLLFYVAIEALGASAPVRALLAPIARWLRSSATLRDRTEGAAAAVVLFPLLTALVVWPLYFLGRALGGSRVAGVGAALVWTTVPSVALISYHADGALTPLLSAGGCALAVLAARATSLRAALLFSAAAGLVAGTALFTNFSMLALVGLTALLPLGTLAEARGLGPSLRRGALLGATSTATAAALLGVLVGTGLFAHPIDRFHAALEHHYEWKAGAIGGRFGVLGMVEFWSYAGPPLLGAVLLAALPAAFRWQGLVPRSGDTLALGVALVQIAMAVTAGCSEDARIWLWLVPLFSAAGVVALRREAAPEAPEAPWVTQVFLQVGLLAVMRASQPW